VIKIGFADRDCQACRSREKCTSSKRARRMLTVRPQAQYEALQRAREREQTPEFAREYAGRAGIEGTLWQWIRVCALRRSRYVGQAKTHLQHLLTAAALNLLRIAQWLLERPRATTRVSAFARLLTAPT
jgi:hypothetical protein